MSWDLKWESRHPYYRMEFYFRAEKRGYAYGSNNTKLLGVSRDNVMQCYYDHDDQIRISEQSFSKILDRGGMELYFKQVEKYTTTLLNTLSTHPDYDDSKALKRYYQKVVEAYGKLYTTYDLSRPEYFAGVERELRKVLDVDAFNLATVPTLKTTLDLEQESFLRIVAEQNSDRLTEHADTYGWIGASEDDVVWDVAYFRRRYDSSDRNEAIVALKKIDHDRSTRLNRREKIINMLNEQNRYLFETVGKMAYIRLESRLNWARADRKFNELLRSIAIYFKVPIQDIEFFSEQDIVNLVDGMVLSQVVLNSRKQAYAFYFDEKTYEIREGEAAVSDLEIREGVQLNIEHTSTIRGNIAQKGKITGMVCKITAHTKNQTFVSESMAEGAILVTGMTRPHLIQAIHKAAAIITDEGGITCHAAIVSRELKKPCIIGTKIATRVLKDGDLVEVDADKGVVRVLKRASG